MPLDYQEQTRRIERALRELFGLRRDNVTGRATEKRCIIACAALAACARAQGVAATVLGASLAIDKPGEVGLTIGVHTIVALPGGTLLDPSIAQASRPRFGHWLDRDVLEIRTGVEIVHGRSIAFAVGDLRLEYQPSASLTALIHRTPDADPRRLAQVMRRVRIGPAPSKSPMP